MSAIHDEDEARLRPAASIVPAGSITGRALVVIIAIMTFLASLTIASVDMVRLSAAEWQSAVTREVTIQVRPREGRDIEDDVRKASELAARWKGVIDVSPYSREETVRMLEPWLGTGLGVSDLPIPRLIIVRTDPDYAWQVPQLAKALAAEIPTASLDDHRQWYERLRTMSRTVVLLGIAIVALMVLTAALSVVFATRAAMATNAQVVEVLHFVGAPDAFIARQFERHFLMLGLRGGVIGGAAAFLLLFGAGKVVSANRATAVADQLEALFGSFAMGYVGGIAIVVLVLMVAAMTAWTSRLTVFRTLQTLD